MPFMGESGGRARYGEAKDNEHCPDAARYAANERKHEENPGT
jgi:hypothetical protein